MRFGAALVTESLVAEAGDLAMYLKVNALKIVKLPGQIENLLRDGRADLKGLRTRIVAQLPDVVSSLARIVHFYLDKLRIA